MACLRKVFGWAVLFGILALGCSKDESPTLCQVATITYTNGADSYTETFTYIDYKVVTRKIAGTGFESNYAYHYNGAMLIDSAATVINGVSGIQVFTYDSASQLKRFTDWSVNRTDTVDYTFNVYNQLIKSVARTAIGVVRDTLTLTYNYPDITTHNPSSITYKQTGIAMYVINYFYDDKLNPIREFLPSIRAYNNVVRTEKNGVVTTIAYVYDDRGLPVSSTSLDGSAQAWTYVCH